MIPNTADTFLPTDLLPNKTYAYRLMPTDSGGNTSLSPTINLTTGSKLSQGIYQSTLSASTGFSGDSMTLSSSDAPTSAASAEQALCLSTNGSSVNHTFGTAYPFGGFTALSSGFGFYGNSYGYIFTPNGNSNTISFDDTAGIVTYNIHQKDRTQNGQSYDDGSSSNCDCPGCCGDQQDTSFSSTGGDFGNGSPGESSGDSSGGSEAASDYPIGYADGSPHFIITDLSSSGFTGAWSIIRNWTTQTQFVPYNTFGYGWMNNRQTYLQNMGGSGSNPDVMVVNTAYSQIEFNYNASTSAYAPTAVTHDGLTHNASAATYTWLNSGSGATSVYYDFSGSNAASLQGKLKAFYDAGGNQISFTYSSQGLLTKVTQADAAGDVEYFNYTYAASGPNAGQVTSIQQTLQCAGASSPTLYRQAVYTYYQGTYAGDDTHGNQGDLKTASIKDGSGNVIDASYYRYYTPTDLAAGEQGYVGGLAYLFQSDSYSKLAAAYSDPFTATDVQRCALRG